MIFTRTKSAQYLVKGLILMCHSHDLVHPMLALVITAPARMAEKEEGLHVGQADRSVWLALLVLRKELERFEELFLILVFILR